MHGACRKESDQGGQARVVDTWLYGVLENVMGSWRLQIPGNAAYMTTTSHSCPHSLQIPWIAAFNASTAHAPPRSLLQVERYEDSVSQPWDNSYNG